MIGTILKVLQILDLHPRRQYFTQRFSIDRIAAIEFTLNNVDGAGLVINIDGINLFVSCTICNAVFRFIGIEVMDIP